jgi:hypothetical protein
VKRDSKLVVQNKAAIVVPTICQTSKREEASKYFPALK